ncbi:hypothetical protein [Paenibacillus massiliensis]|uniref:hypothetical protein n=1 Tax=Paenibacillus massiliensis TaxID=225917 RepID=UPI0004235000|nr:hypothetical protein [Paenibacillus massiliensis]
MLCYNVTEAVSDLAELHSGALPIHTKLTNILHLLARVGFCSEPNRTETEGTIASDSFLAVRTFVTRFHYVLKGFFALPKKELKGATKQWQHNH